MLQEYRASLSALLSRSCDACCILAVKIFKVAIPFKRAFFLAPGSPTGKWANSEVLPLGGDSAKRLPPFKVNTRCGPGRRFYCACDFAALLKISVGRGSFYQGTRSDRCGSLSPVHRGADSRGQRKAKMVGPFRAAIPIYSCGRRFFGARYSGAVDCL